MNDDASLNEIDSATFALNEFSALNDEIIKRLEIQYQFIGLTLIVAGTFLSLGTQNNVSPMVLLVYPIIALFLAVGWQQNATVIRQLGLYIRDHIESKVKGGGWGTYRQRMFSVAFKKNLTTLFTRGTFVGTQLIAMIPALPRLTFLGLEIAMLTIDLICLVTTVRVIKRPSFITPEEQILESQRQ